MHFKIVAHNRPAIINLVEQKTLQWISRQNFKGAGLSSNMIKGRARFYLDVYTSILGLPESGFNFSNGWFEGFKQRYKLVYVKMNGEKCSADTSAVPEFIEKFRRIIEDGGYQLHQVYNVDETGAIWKQTATSTFVPELLAKTKQVSTVKSPKSQVTLLLGGNATGDHKLKPFLVNKYQNPAGLKGDAIKESLSFYFRQQSNAWMDTYLFEDWLLNCFLPEVEAHQKKLDPSATVKALLLVDNAKVHLTRLPDVLPKPKEGGVHLQIEFLSPNTTSLIQPMDQTVIRTFKSKYINLMMDKSGDKRTWPVTWQNNPQRCHSNDGRSLATLCTPPP